MIAYTFVNITFIKIYQRFGNAATGAGKTGKQFKRAQRLVSLQMMIAIIKHQYIRNHQRNNCAGDSV